MLREVSLKGRPSLSSSPRSPLWNQPLRNASGGMATATGSEQDGNVIALALAATDNENAFQQHEDVGTPSIFDIKDSGTQAAILGRVRRVFERFERLKRFKLLEETLEWRNGPEESDLVLYFKYVALEADEVRDYSQSFT